MCVLLFDAFTGWIFFSKEIKGNVKNLLWRKTDVLKTCRKSKFEEQKGTRFIRGNVYFGIVVLSCLSSTKPCLIFLLICFAPEIKGIYQSSFRNEVNFRDIMNVSPNI